MPEVNIPSNKFKEIFFDRVGSKKTYEEIVDELVGIAISGTMDKIQLQAIMYTLDRVLGKPAVSEVVEHEGAVEVNITRTEGRSPERLAEIKANAKVKWAKEKDVQDEVDRESGESGEEDDIT